MALPRLDPFQIYFTFADGEFGYHCRECGFRCCRGAGFGATKSELVQLTKQYPTLPMFVSPQREPELPLVGLTNFSPRCFFLRDDGLCRVESDLGREAKPYVCRMFPANQLSRHGDLIVIDMNFLCPMRPLRDGDTPVRHADVLADLARSMEVPAALPSEAAEDFPEALFAHERFLRDLPPDDDLLTRLAFADVMASRWSRDPRPPSMAFIEPHRAYLAALRRDMIALLGLEQALDPATPRFSREQQLMTPRVRLGLLRMRPPGVTLDDVMPALGRRLVALSVYVELIASLGGEITLGVVDAAARQGQLFCEMLSQTDRVPLLLPGDESYQLTLYRTQEAAMQRFLTFVHDENPRRRLTLHQVMLEIGMSNAADRAQLCQSFTREALPRFRFEASSS